MRSNGQSDGEFVVDDSDQAKVERRWGKSCTVSHRWFDVCWGTCGHWRCYDDAESIPLSCDCGRSSALPVRVILSIGMRPRAGV